jgi:integrase
VRKKVYGRTKTDVKDKLRQLHDDLDQGIRPTTAYTVQRACEDWLRDGLDGRSAKTIRDAGDSLKPILAIIGHKPLRELIAADVRAALAKSAAIRSTRTVEISRNCLVRAIRHAEANDRVRRNVAALVTPPKGQVGRASHAMSLGQAAALLRAAEKSTIYAYLVVSLTTGIRTEEARALRWDHVTLDENLTAEVPVPPHAAVWRSVRAHGDVKTENRDAPWLSLSSPCTRSRSKRSGRRGIASLQGRSGRNMGWCSHRRSGQRLIPHTCGDRCVPSAGKPK